MSHPIKPNCDHEPQYQASRYDEADLNAPEADEAGGTIHVAVSLCSRCHRRIIGAQFMPYDAVVRWRLLDSM